MICFRLILLFFCALPKLSIGLSVDMQGAIRLGKDVMDTLSRILLEDKMNGRKMIYFRQRDGDEVVSDLDTDSIAVTVNREELCGELKFCQGDIGILFNHYIVMLTRAVETVFEALLGIGNRPNEVNLKSFLFEQELRRIMEDIKKMLVKVNDKISKPKEAFMWKDLFKRINGKFQERADAYALLKLEGIDNITEVKKRLSQKIIIATSLVELEFENRLCSEHNICSKKFKCTEALDTVLERITTEVPAERVKEFIKSFYETLPRTNFYYRISDTTGNAFQEILYDMAHQNIGTDRVLTSLHKNVRDRLNVVKSDFQKPYSTTSWDVKLVHIILSDMDHFYSSKQKQEPFYEFMGDFFEWSKIGGRFDSPLRKLMKDIQNILTYESDDMVRKLVNEVKVFMEITVDPDP